MIKTAMQELKEMADAQDKRIAQKRMTQAVTRAANESFRPSVLYRPALALDGNKWCALYGPSLMEGVAGFGDSPAEAMADFDKNWTKKLEPEA